MSSGSPHMAGSALGRASSLLLLASIIQGFQDIQVIHNERMEALEGEDVILPCTVKSTDLKIISIEWKKKQSVNEKLAVLSPGLGVHTFLPNVTILKNSESMGSLRLSNVSKWNSGVYTCDLSTFPYGTFRRETYLKIKDPVPTSLPSNVTDTGLIPKTESELTTTAATTTTTVISTIHSTETWTMSDQKNKSTTGNLITSVTSDTTVTSPPGPLNTTNRGINSTHSFNTSIISHQPVSSTPVTTITNQTVSSNPVTTITNQSVSSIPATTFNYTTQEMRNESRGAVTGSNDMMTIRDDMLVTEDADIEGVQSYLVVLLIMALLLVLIAVAGFLYRRHVLKQRMDLPPSFKPPPPPVKYASARQSDVHIQHFPTSRCNSVAELEAERQNFII